MTNVDFKSVSDLKDIESITFYNESKKLGKEKKAWEGILHKARDHARTPIQWDNTPNAGFSEHTPWMMVNPNYKEINVLNQVNDDESILNFYKKMINLKSNNEILLLGEVEEIKLQDEIFAYYRNYNNEKIMVLCNLSDKELTINQIDYKEIILSNKEFNQGSLSAFELQVFKI